MWPIVPKPAVLGKLVRCKPLSSWKSKCKDSSIWLYILTSYTLVQLSRHWSRSYNQYCCKLSPTPFLPQQFMMGVLQSVSNTLLAAPPYSTSLTLKTQRSKYPHTTVPSYVYNSGDMQCLLTTPVNPMIPAIEWWIMVSYVGYHNCTVMPCIVWLHASFYDTQLYHDSSL